MVQRHKINIFYTAPTAIRALMKMGDDPVKKYDRSSLKTLGTVGEPINPEAWNWYYNVVGDQKCDIVDTYWQTETGGHVITGLSGTTPMKPGSASFPFYGIELCIMEPTVEDPVSSTAHRQTARSLPTAESRWLVCYARCRHCAANLRTMPLSLGQISVLKILSSSVVSALWHFRIFFRQSGKGVVRTRKPDATLIPRCAPPVWLSVLLNIDNCQTASAAVCP
jgi:hypothetical protein